MKLELTESSVLGSLHGAPISSLYAQANQLPPELAHTSCVSIEYIAVEKFVALLRRIARFERGYDVREDPRLIRHVYDLHLIASKLNDPKRFKDIALKVIKSDQVQFGGKHQEFIADSFGELRWALSCVSSAPRYEKHYQRFIGPMVYNQSVPEWPTALKSVEQFAACWLSD